MDADRIWNWAERAAVVVIAPLCALVGAYFAAGTYYGWDKQDAVPVIKDHASGPAMTLPAWLGFALLGVAIVSLLTSWAMIGNQRCSRTMVAARVGRPQNFSAMVQRRSDLRL